MAKVTAPLHGSEARGKVGGLVYNTWRGISTVKAKKAPSQPRTALQLQRRATGVALSRQWQANAYHDDWNTFASLHPRVDGMGATVRATGANWFLGLGARLLMHARPIVATPPAIPGPNPVTGLTAVGGAATITYNWTDPGAGDDRIEFYLDGPHSGGRLASLVKAKFASYLAGNVADATLTGLMPGNYALYARTMSPVNGQVSEWVLAECVVT